MSNRPWLVFAALLAVSCGGGSKPEPEAAAPAAPPARKVPKPVDESARFPKKDLIEVKLVEGHVLDKGLLPGGNVGFYRNARRSYQLFLIKTPTTEAAALLLNDFKSSLGAFKYVPSFGGFYGMDGATPVFAFQKSVYLAGVVGLTQEEADAVAREFAARL